MKNKVVDEVRTLAQGIYDAIQAGKRPDLDIPKRVMSNVGFDPAGGYIGLGEGQKRRSLTYSTAKSFAQLLRMCALIMKTIKGDEQVTKREAYYISKNWGDAAFGKQAEGDDMLLDVEAKLRVTREQMRVTPEEKGGEVAGRLKVTDRNPRTNRTITIDCTEQGQGAWSVPANVEGLGFETGAQFVLAIETAGMFQRLNSHAFWDDHNCILVSMGGVPTRACRRFIRRLSDEEQIPVYAFVDGDPYGYSNIYRTLKVGSANSAHVNRFFSVPVAKFLGVTPMDIERYDLPTHPLSSTDVKRAKDARDKDPFFGAFDAWQIALNSMLCMEVRAEQQAFAKHSLNFVLETYLPEKLASNRFLP